MLTPNLVLLTLFSEVWCRLFLGVLWVSPLGTDRMWGPRDRTPEAQRLVVWLPNTCCVARGKLAPLSGFQWPTDAGTLAPGSRVPCSGQTRGQGHLTKHGGGEPGAL